MTARERKHKPQPESQYYDGADLRPLAGVGPARFVAFHLPSIINGQRVWPQRPAWLPGAPNRGTIKHNEVHVK